MSLSDRERLDATNRRRVAMRFVPLTTSGRATNSETFDNVARKMRVDE